jgi:peroxiredoxin Q/BCP
MKLTFFFFASFLITAAMTISAHSAEPLKEGDEAPDFELMGSDGNTYKLSDVVKERAVVIAWFPKAFTGG